MKYKISNHEISLYPYKQLEQHFCTDMFHHRLKYLRKY